MRCVLAVGFCMLAAATAGGAEKPSAKPLQSGPKPGDSVPSFYTRVVTGPLRNKSICYVCRNAARPVVMVLMRKITPEMKPLLKGIDRIVDKNRAAGLRGFGVLISDDSRKATSAVQTFAFDNRIQFPLTIAGETVASAAGHNLHKEAAITVVLYRKQKVVRTWTYRAGELKTDDVELIARSVREFAAAK